MSLRMMDGNTSTGRDDDEYYHSFNIAKTFMKAVAVF